MKTFLRHVLLDLTGVVSSERLCMGACCNSAAMPGVCWIGWYSVIHTYAFISTVWFWRERCEALSFVAIRRLLVHGEVRGGEYHEGRIGGLAIGGLSLYTVEGFPWCFGFHNSSMQVGAATHVKFRILPFRMKIQGLVLIGCASQGFY
jgi:hypothetical protein